MTELLITQSVLSTTSTEQLLKVFTELAKTDDALNKKFSQEELILMGEAIRSPDFLQHSVLITRMYGIRQQKCMLSIYHK